MALSFDFFIGKIKELTEIPTDYFQEVLLNGTFYADPDVNAAFLKGQTGNYITYGKSQINDIIRELAVKYPSYVMSTLADTATFNIKSTIKDINFDTVDNWFLKNSNSIGEIILMDYLYVVKQLKDYIDAGPGWASQVADKVATDAFFQGINIQESTDGSFSVNKALLTVIKIIDDNGDNFQKVWQEWATSKLGMGQEQDMNVDWLSTTEANFQQGQSAYQQWASLISNASEVQEPPYQYSKLGVNAYNKYGSYYNHLVMTYGKRLQVWLDSTDGPRKFDLRSGNSVQNVTDNIVDAPSSGCLTADTRILLDDGTELSVGQIKEGDRLRHTQRGYSTLGSEFPVNPSLKYVYSINDDEPFMSLEHAIMTQRGWCSMAPNLTKDLAPHHQVKLLTIGDVVLKVKNPGQGTVSFDKVVVKRINMKSFDLGKGPQGFGIQLRGGHHSYFANGYCCLVTYPEMTAQRITSNMRSNMTPSEQFQFNKKVNELSPLLDKALGNTAWPGLKRALMNPQQVAAYARHTDQHGLKKAVQRDAEHFVIPFMEIHPHKSSAPLPTSIKNMALLNGRLFINGFPVKTHCKDRHVFWERKADGGGDEIGALKLMPHGLLGHGVIQHGDAVMGFQANSLVGYTTTFGNDNQPWYEFDMGFQPNENGAMAPFGEITDPDDDSINTLLTGSTNGVPNVQVTFSQTNHQQDTNVLMATVNINSALCVTGLVNWIEAEIYFSPDYRTFTGNLYPYDITRPDNQFKGDPLPLKGTSKEQDNLTTMQQRLTATMKKERLNKPALQLHPEGNTLSANLQKAVALTDSIALSVQDLFSLPAPDMENLHEQSFGKLKNLMLFALNNKDKTWMSWFGETAPAVGPDGTLTQQEADLSANPDVNSFLVNQFGIGYLTQAFSTSDDQNIKAIFDAQSNVDDKLSYFWKGNGSTSFAQSKGYNIATAKLMTGTYAENVTGLEPYLDNNPTDWAKQLYEYCTAETTLNGLAIQTTLDNRTKLNHLGMMLYALDPGNNVDTGNGQTISYSASLYEKVIEQNLNNVVNNSKTGGISDDFISYLTAFFQQYFNSLLNDSSWDDSIKSQAKQDLEQMMQDAGVKDVEALITSYGDIIADTCNLLLSFNDLPIPARLQKWAAKYPKASTTLSVGITIALYGYATFQCFDAFLNWKDLRDDQKAQAIINSIDTVTSIFKDFATYKAAATLTKAGVAAGDLCNACLTLNAEISKIPFVTSATMIESMDIVDSDLNSSLLAAAGKVAAADLAATDMATAAVKWSKIAFIGDAAAKSINVVAMAAAIVVTGFQISDDFKTNQPLPVKALDILQEVANGVAFTIESAAGIAALAGAEVAAAVPIVGVVVAVIGIGIAIALLFIQRNPPPTPQEDFVNQQCIPFLNTLEMPSQDWLDQQSAINNHLESGSGTGTGS